MLGAFHEHAFNPKSESQRPLFRGTCCWHWCVLQVLTLEETIRHRSHAEM